jgi:hypothetical protein
VCIITIKHCESYYYLNPLLTEDLDLTEFRLHLQKTIIIIIITTKVNKFQTVQLFLN